MICLRNHFGSETTIISNSPAVLSNIPVSDDSSVNLQDHTIINIDTLEVKNSINFHKIYFLTFVLLYSVI